MSKDICKIFGRNLYKIRTGKGISQEELGFEVGLDKSTIGKYELAKRCINLRTAKNIADALGVKLSDMLD
ncbi:TPA: helix-turn-helix transcriptional regulator [Candidatus Scatousia excrementigallinarum]|uniref:Helix-turn-helix transcriptional regulator n=1 Tax=Candidatus Scatousia excrementigallinarum TaxID=2840935 RepID=A0A9D1EYB8_9BACT|nr:helix-turn-helix transcriptional regulator [Candidatus Scatousia excrementigallinarum]